MASVDHCHRLHQLFHQVFDHQIHDRLLSGVVSGNRDTRASLPADRRRILLVIVHERGLCARIPARIRQHHPPNLFKRGLAPSHQFEAVAAGSPFLIQGGWRITSVLAPLEMAVAYPLDPQHFIDSDAALVAAPANGGKPFVGAVMMRPVT